MAHRKYYLHNGQRGAALAVRVTSSARKDEITNVLKDGTLRIRLTSPPEVVKTNQALEKFLAKVLNIPKSKIEVVAGLTGQDKLVSVLDMDAELAHKKIFEHLSL